jgi:hypothetical protein
LHGETTGRILDLELWDLDSPASSARKPLPKTALLPVSFSQSSRWEATRKR